MTDRIQSQAPPFFSTILDGQIGGNFFLKMSQTIQNEEGEW